VRLQELGVVHPVEMVAGQDQIEIRIVRQEMSPGLADGVGGPLEPARGLWRLLGREDLHEPARVLIYAIGVADVPVERGRVELRQHEDAPQVGVQAVADRHVDEPVLAADRDRRLGAQLGERMEARTLAAAEDEGEHIAHQRSG